MLALLPLRLRLGTCSLVCRTWAAAAADATTAITVTGWEWSRRDQQRWDALAAWLRQHASPAALHQLVFNRRGFTYANGPLPSFDPPLQQLRGLRVLRLAPCQLPAGNLRELSGLSALTDLDLHDVRCSSSPAIAQQAAQQQPPMRDAAAEVASSLAATTAELAHALPRLPALSHLSLGGASVRLLCCQHSQQEQVRVLLLAAAVAMSSSSSWYHWRCGMRPASPLT